MQKLQGQLTLADGTEFQSLTLEKSRNQFVDHRLQHLVGPNVEEWFGFVHLYFAYWAEFVVFQVAHYA